MKAEIPRITFWRVLLVAILSVGAWATWVRFAQGLGPSTNLSDDFPWGIWIGFDVLCGVMLAAGGFTLMAVIHIFNLKQFKPIARPALLTAYLGYVLVCVALMYDLGKPWNIWHPLIMWNPHSVMFEVGWCVMLYTTVLTLEFLPIVFERFRMERPLRILHMISTPLIIAGIILSTLHQSSLGSLFLIMPGKMHPLWYTSILPFLFFISAVAIGLAMTIFESSLSARTGLHHLQRPLLTELSRILLVVLLFYATFRGWDLIKNDRLKFAFDGSYEGNFFLGEIFLSVLIPVALLFSKKVRESANGLYLVSILVVGGFLMNRLNVATTAMERASGVRYIPKWTEVSVTLAIVAFGVFIFALAVKYLPIFEKHEELVMEEERVAPAAAALPAPVQS
jgi:Ni/Fe-hydrogenase subunit HybB-like protein